MTGLDLWIDGRLKGEMPSTVAVEPGVRLVQVRAPVTSKVLAEAWVDLGTDESISVFGLMPPAPELGVGVGGGMLAMLGPAPTPSLLPTGSVAASLSNWPFPGQFLELSFLGAYGVKRLEQVHADSQVTLLRFGGSWGLEWDTNAFQVGTGPSVGAMMVKRGFSGIDVETEYAVTPWVGGLVFVSTAALPPIRAGFSIRGAYLPLPLDGGVAHTGFIEALLVLDFFSNL
jgi:hypothetical protein